MCFGGGGGGQPEGAPDHYYDHLVNAGEQELQMSQELMNFYKHGSFGGENTYGPSMADLEKKQIQANYQLVDPQVELQEKQIEQQRQTLPMAGEAERAGLEQSVQTAPMAGEAERAKLKQSAQTAPMAGETQRMGLEEQQQVMRQRAPVLRQYFQEAQNVDPETRANRARAETAQQFEQARDQATRNITRTGATPGSNRASAMMGDLATQQAKATSAAKNIARRRGEEEKFNRLSQAVGGAGSIGG